MTYRPTTSSETAAAFLARYQPRKARERRYRPRNDREAERIDFRERVFAVVGRLTVKTAKTIRLEVEQDYGPLHYGRIDRALQSLVEMGRVRRVDGGWLRAKSRAS